MEPLLCRRDEGADKHRGAEEQRRAELVLSVSWRVRRGFTDKIVEDLITVELRSLTPHCEYTRQVLPTRTQFNHREDDVNL